MRQTTLLFFILLMFACKAKTSTNSTEHYETKKPPCRLVVSFYKEAFDQLKLYLSKEESNIKYEVKSWGREGEKDICLKLTGLTAQEQIKFIGRIKSKLNGKNLIRIKENSICH